MRRSPRAAASDRPSGDNASQFGRVMVVTAERRSPVAGSNSPTAPSCHAATTEPSELTRIGPPAPGTTATTWPVAGPRPPSRPRRRQSPLAITRRCPANAMSGFPTPKAKRTGGASGADRSQTIWVTGAGGSFSPKRLTAR